MYMLYHDEEAFEQELEDEMEEEEEEIEDRELDSAIEDMTSDSDSESESEEPLQNEVVHNQMQNGVVPTPMNANNQVTGVLILVDGTSRMATWVQAEESFMMSGAEPFRTVAAYHHEDIQRLEMSRTPGRRLRVIRAKMLVQNVLAGDFNRALPMFRGIIWVYCFIVHDDDAWDERIFLPFTTASLAMLGYVERHNFLMDTNLVPVDIMN